jgi:hypothetical protein
MNRTLQRLIVDPRVATINDESRSGDGYWVYLQYGWQRGDLPPSEHDKPGGSNQHLHIVHEWTVRDLLAGMREVSPCKCWECVKGEGA